MVDAYAYAVDIEMGCHRIVHNVQTCVVIYTGYGAKNDINGSYHLMADQETLSSQAVLI